MVVTDPTTGVSYDSPSIEGAYDLCATGDGLFVHTRLEEDGGQLVSFEGRLTAALRPRDCWVPSHQCTGVRPCTPGDAPKGTQLRVHMDNGAGLMDGEPGKPADGEPLWDRHVFGFEPGTLEVIDLRTRQRIASVDLGQMAGGIDVLVDARDARP